MSKAGSASKVKINSFDDLFGASQAPAGTEQVREIPLSELHEFKGHPFKVLDDEKMQETVESIRNYGVLMPGIARPRAGGGYEIIAGHRRKHGCELAGLSTMPMFVRDYSDDEATVIMVDTNIQREDILPSEKARAWALHLDEATPHIQERHVFDCENRYGEICPQQEKALEALGFELPDPTKKQGRHNNRKMTFDSACRAMLFDIAKRHGLHLEQEPEYGGRAYLEKQDFILAKQKEQLEVQEQRLEELTLKIEDVETLIDDVADIAYDKAVEVVTDTVRVETHKEDIRLIEETKTWLQSPERKAPKKERDYAISRLDGVIGKIKNAMQSALQKIQSRLLSPEVKKTSKEQIKEKVKPSILARLERNKELAKQENEARRSEHRPHKKQNMEL